MLDIDNIAKSVHAVYMNSDVVDQNGMPAIYHVLRVFTNCKDEQNIKVLALLHDVVEDGLMTFADVYSLLIKSANDPSDAKDIDEIIKGLKYITKPSYVKTSKQYYLYIESINENYLAKQVKIADIKSNLYNPITRKLTREDIARINKYMKSLMILEQ